VLVIDQSEYIEDRPLPGPFPAFPVTKREKPWERGCSGFDLQKGNFYSLKFTVLGFYGEIY
jgi:hypothetical protein